MALSLLHVVGLVYGDAQRRKRELGVLSNRNSSKYGGVVKLHSVRGKRVDGSRETERDKEGGRNTEEGESKFRKLKIGLRNRSILRNLHVVSGMPWG